MSGEIIEYAENLFSQEQPQQQVPAAPQATPEPMANHGSQASADSPAPRRAERQAGSGNQPRRSELDLQRSKASDQEWYEKIKESTHDPEWPPLPTMSRNADPSALNGEALEMEPRNVRRSNGVAPAVAGQGQLLFSCPACLTVLRVPHIPGYQPTAVPCPRCQSTIIPPRLAIQPQPQPYPAYPVPPVPPPHYGPQVGIYDGQ